MTTYELLKTITPERMHLMVIAGIITPEWRRATQIYDYFEQQRQHTGVMDAYDLTGERFFMSDENVRKIIRKLKRQL